MVHSIVLPEIAPGFQVARSFAVFSSVARCLFDGIQCGALEIYGSLTFLSISLRRILANLFRGIGRVSHLSNWIYFRRGINS